jgi:hypothetical protein
VTAALHKVLTGWTPSPARLVHIDRDPFEDLPVLLVPDLLRFHHRNHLLAHQHGTQGEGRPAGSRSKTGKLTGVLIATVRDP